LKGAPDAAPLEIASLSSGYPAHIHSVGAVGGFPVAQSALGGAAFGKFVLTSAHRDTQAVEFFSKLCNGMFLPRDIHPQHN